MREITKESYFQYSTKTDKRDLHSYQHFYRAFSRELPSIMTFLSIIFLALTFTCSIASAKVTYEDAIQQDEELKLANPHTPRTHGFTSSELSVQTSTSDTRAWYNLLGSRGNNGVYWNTTSHPIVVAVTPRGERWEEMIAYVNGIRYGRIYSGDFGGGATITMEVPAGGSYQVSVRNLRGAGYGITSWLEFR
ncbi:hypothetical protein [Vibrio sp.]|uniref:hypothetical protein n=1 Tax=Vibrio sp. TaxID=678 RepID=UPI0031203664